MSRVTTLVALAGAVVLVAVSCGGGGAAEPLSKAEYEQQMGAITQDVTKSVNSLGAATTASGAASSLKTLQAELETAADEMGSIAPPDEVKAEHAELVDGVRAFGDELEPIIAKLEDGDLAALGGVQTLAAVTTIQKASAAINSKGFDISGPS